MKLEVLINLGILDASENRILGEIPATLGNCIRLEQLHMGGIPQALSSLRGLQELDLSRNNLRVRSRD